MNAAEDRRATAETGVRYRPQMTPTPGGGQHQTAIRTDPGGDGRKAQWQDSYDENIAPHLPGYVKPSVATSGQQQEMARGLGKKGSFGRSLARFQLLRDINPSYSQPENQLREHTLGQLERLQTGDSTVDLRSGDVDYRKGGAGVDYQRGQTRDFLDTVNYRRGETDLMEDTVNYRRGETDALEDTVDYRRGGDEMIGDLKTRARSAMATGGLDDSPMLAKLSLHTRERLGTGLTPEEAAAFRGQQIEAVEGSAAESRRTMANDFAASGMDPRAAMSAMGRIENSRMQGRAGVERDMIARELARKAEIEQLGLGVAGEEVSRLGQAEAFARGVGDLAEGARQFDVQTAEEARRSIADLYERGRAFDVETAEGARQQMSDLRERGRAFDVGTAAEERRALADLYERGRQYDVDTGERVRQFDVTTGENTRQYNVTAEQARRQEIERQLLEQAALAEGRREYDLGFVEARRQAKINRELLRKMQREAEPTGLERAGAILGGIRGALSQGG